MIKNKSVHIFFLLVFLTLQCISLIAQVSIENCEFVSPVRHKVKLSGTFGELRSNHFHAGIDIKSSNGGSGDPILAAEKGYISRIKIQASGYGRSLYISHPNGYTTVYAHLKSFRPDIEKFIRDQQYRKKRFALNVYPTRNQFKIERGEEIGKMGNTGGSSGPHLHFEIRKTASEIPYNPLDFNAFCGDSISPVVKELKIYGLDQNFHPNYSINKWLSKNGKSISNDTLVVPAWRMGLAIRVHDRSNGSHNKNGIYSIEMKVDGIQHYKFTADKCGFYETRYINAHMDYAECITNKKYWHKCYILPANHLSMYERNGKTGVFDLYAERPRKVEFKILDAHGNQTAFQFWVKRKKDFEAPISAPYQFHLKHHEDNYLTLSNLSLYMPKESLYQDNYFNIKPIDPNDDYKKFTLGDHTTPLHKYSHVTIQLDTLIVNKDKLILTKYDKKRKRYNSFGGQIDGSMFKVKLRELGTFRIQMDTIPPKIKIVHFPSILKKDAFIKFKITDNFTPFGKSRNLTFIGEIDGKWALLEYDLKTKTLTHYLDNRTPKGEHKFELVVKDDRNNISRIEKTFTIQ